MWRGREEDHLLREQAAEVTGMALAELPPAKVLAGVVKWLFDKVNDDRTAPRIPEAKLTVLCKYFDPQLTVRTIQHTLDAVGGRGHLSQRTFYYWVCLMFGSSSSTEFYAGINEFAAAADKVTQVMREANGQPTATMLQPAGPMG